MNAQQLVTAVDHRVAECLESYIIVGFVVGGGPVMMIRAENHDTELKLKGLLWSCSDLTVHGHKPE